MNASRPLSSWSELAVKLFADCADLNTLRSLARDTSISGFTTNPTLMRRAGVRNYTEFARAAIDIVAPRPISLEVLSDEIPEIEQQAHIISSWGTNVYVKIPITTSSGLSTLPLVQRLSLGGVRVNVTALTTPRQTSRVAEAVSASTPSLASVFAGRIADTGRDPIPIMRRCAALLAGLAQCELVWASSRELLNVVHAAAAGCDIITLTHDILARLSQLGKDLAVVSLETVRMFRDDAAASGLCIVTDADGAERTHPHQP